MVFITDLLTLNESTYIMKIKTNVTNDILATILNKPNNVMSFIT